MVNFDYFLLFVFFRGWLNTDEMRESFFRAANILDPEWIQTYNNDKDGIKNISTIEAKVSVYDIQVK